MSYNARQYQEKRHFIRMQIDAPASLRLSSGEEIDLTCLDLSSCGVQLQSEKPLPLGDSAELCLSSCGGPVAPLSAKITLCRHESISDSEYRTGAVIESFL